jgi:DNA polymerase-3 subunit epsilon
MGKNVPSVPGSGKLPVPPAAARDRNNVANRLDHFGLRCPEFDYLCTYRVAERIWPDLPAHNLKALAAHIGHDFNHHHA